MKLLFLQVVPTTYTNIRNASTYTNQYSVTEHFKLSDVAQGHNLPGVFFFYDLSPIQARTQDNTLRCSKNAHCLTSVLILLFALLLYVLPGKGSCTARLLSAKI